VVDVAGPIMMLPPRLERRSAGLGALLLLLLDPLQLGDEGGDAPAADRVHRRAAVLDRELVELIGRQGELAAEYVDQLALPLRRLHLRRAGRLRGLLLLLFRLEFADGAQLDRRVGEPEPAAIGAEIAG